MSTWFVFFTDTCPRAMSDLSKARYYKGLDKGTCPFHLSDMSVSIVPRAFSNQSLDNTICPNLKTPKDLKHEANYYRIFISCDAIFEVDRAIASTTGCFEHVK